MPDQTSLSALRARVQALEIMVILGEVTDESEKGGDLRQRVAERRARLAEIGQVIGNADEGSDAKAAIKQAFDRLGNLLEAMGGAVADELDRRGGGSDAETR